MNNKFNARLLAFTVILLALALIFGYIEFMFPLNIGQVGIKIGLTNIVTILGLKIIGVQKTLLLNIIRLIILGFIFGNLIRFYISVSGFILSFIVMYITLNILKFKIITSSIFGGVAHNIGQIIAVSFLVKNTLIISLIPLYILVGILTGALIGVISTIIYKKIVKLRIT